MNGGEGAVNRPGDDEVIQWERAVSGCLSTKGEKVE